MGPPKFKYNHDFFLPPHLTPNSPFPHFTNLSFLWRKQGCLCLGQLSSKLEWWQDLSGLRRLQEFDERLGASLQKMQIWIKIFIQFQWFMDWISVRDIIVVHSCVETWFILVCYLYNALNSYQSFFHYLRNMFLSDYKIYIYLFYQFKNCKNYHIENDSL